MSGAVNIPAPVAELLKRAIMHIDTGRPADAVECLAASSVLDIQRYQQRFLASAATAGIVADLYARAVGAGAAPLRAGASGPGGPLRVAYVLFQAAAGQAACRRVLNLVRHHDRARIEPLVVVTEDLCRRDPATTTLVLPDEPSEAVGGEALRGMREAGAGVHLVDRRGTHLEAGARAAELIRSLDVDVAVYLGSPATAVQAVCAIRRGAPVQVNLNIGVPLLVPGIDAVIYTNPYRQAEDAPELARRSLRVMGLECSGCAALAASRATPMERAALGVPGGALLAVTASNKLATRVADGTFGRDLGAFLFAHPEVWWVGVGPREPDSAWKPLRDAGVMGRVVLTGPMPDITPVLRVADVYLNEYPEGGYNTVVESMAAGAPAVALAVGTRHAERAGAILTGESGAAADVGAYWARASAWVGSAEARARAREVQRARGLSFDYSAVCATYERMLWDLAGLGQRR